MQTQPTTPFGRRPLSLAMVASQAATENFAARPGASETVVHKWRLYRALTEAKEPLGVTDRALSVLHALLSFHQETALTLPASDSKSAENDSSGHGIVVFPSNRGTLDPRPWHGAGDAAAAFGLPRRRRADHPARLSERQALRQERAGGRDRGRLRFRPHAARRARRRNRKPRRGGARREPRDGAAARKDHADAARHRQDDRDRHRGGRSGRLGRLSPALCDALRPLRAQSFALRFGGFGERIGRACRRNP